VLDLYDNETYGYDTWDCITTNEIVFRNGTFIYIL
jgi:hypothetical protein